MDGGGATGWRGAPLAGAGVSAKLNGGRERGAPDGPAAVVGTRGVTP